MPSAQASLQDLGPARRSLLRCHGYCSPIIVPVGNLPDCSCSQAMGTFSLSCLIRIGLTRTPAASTVTLRQSFLIAMLRHD